MKTATDEQMDYEANVFAVSLLMPTNLFKEEFNKLRDVKSKEYLADEDARILRLSKIFNVPLFAVVMKMQLLAKF